MSRSGFDLPAPEAFQQNPARELELSPDEEATVLRAARKEKYTSAYTAWYKWKTIQDQQPKPFTFEQVGAWFQAEAARYLGKPYIIDDNNRHIVRALCLYFAEDERFESEGFGSLQKGLLLRGGVGCGKTTLLTIFSRNPRLPFVVTPCRELVGDYTEQGQPGQPAGGADALRVHTKLIKLVKGNEARYNYRTHAGLCLDDIGTEDWKAKHYGRELNVVEHIISSRDDSVVAGDMPRWATHATTNVPFDDYQAPDGKTLPGLETIYGTRWRSRVRGLFNILSFPDAAADRRA
ncbi:MAG TPA: hypothetical protein VF690_21180 [Hymenobacter sp.]|jgi:hypothetical protein